MDRWERRAAKQDSKRKAMRVHGRNLATLYARVTLARAEKGQGTRVSFDVR